MFQDILKIIGNEITYYVVVPFIVLILNWIKNGYDIRERNKELGYWKMKFRKLQTFPDIAMKIYKWLAVNLAVMQGARILLLFWKSELYSYAASGVTYLILNTLIIFTICKDAKTKIEFLSNGKYKKILIGVLYIIYGVVFFENLFAEFKLISEIVLGMVLVMWVFLLFKFSDVAFILDNGYADIYVKDSEVTECVAAGTITKQGEWIIVNRYANEYDEEIRIKESDIVRIDYYGEPIILFKKRRLFKS